MPESDQLAESFELNRAHLRSVAYRILGSPTEADDAVQEAWLRLSRSDTSSVDNLTGWLTTVTARVCLDMLRSRRSRREEPLSPSVARAEAEDDATGPEDEVVMADSLGLALLVVLDTLTPSERVAFVLHDLFGVSFDEIAPIVQRSPTASRQLASRARRRVRGARTPAAADADRQRDIVAAFLAASRGGDFEALVALLDPEVVVRSDAAAVRIGAEAEVRGARQVAATFAGRAQAAELALIDGLAGLVWSRAGRPVMLFAFTLADGRIREINLIADRGELDRVTLLTDRSDATA